MPPLTPPDFCWICMKPVSPEDSKTDEYGFSVHKSCFQLENQKRPERPSAKQAKQGG